MTGEMPLPTRLAGAIWGHLVGDAVGVPYEFRPAADIGEVRFGASGTHHQPPGTWSDDGALMLALLDSLLTVGFDVEDQGRRAVDWYRRSAYTPDGSRFDIGNATRSALDAIDRGRPAAEAGGTDEGANGNGSLMRILPLALVQRQVRDARLIDEAHAASRVTHGTEPAQVTCALYSLIVRALLHGRIGLPEVLADARRHLRAVYASTPTGAPKLAALDRIEAHRDRAGRGSVWDSFWSAWDAFAGAAGYRETIERAVAYGNDTDTTAAIAGGLAGLRWGIDGIPADWLAGMRGRQVVDPLVDRLIATDGWRTSTSNPLRVDWVNLALVPALAAAPGRLGMTLLPGKHQADGAAGKHWRNLEEDAQRLREVDRADTFVLLVEDAELLACGVPDFVEVLAGHDIAVLREPIPDGDIPPDLSAFRTTLDTLSARLAAGETIVVACRGGLGRTGTLVACLLENAGLEAEDAIALTHASRPKTIETSRQKRFVRDWPRSSSGDPGSAGA